MILAGVAAVGILGGMATASFFPGPSNFPGPPPAHPLSKPGGIMPTQYAGDDSATGTPEEVCAAMGVDISVPGIYRGERVLTPDPEFDQYSDGNIDIDRKDDGGRRFFAWATGPDVEMLAFLIRSTGDNGYHIYDYQGVDISFDSWLSPTRNAAGAIQKARHIAFCYRLPPEEQDLSGCTPGYWRNHADRWAGFTPAQSFNAVFGVGPAATLGQVVSTPQTYGAFYMHAVAALLNSVGGVPNGDGTKVAYKYTTAEVIAMVQNAVNIGTKQAIGQAKDKLEAANEEGCPLSGTPAKKV
ncbi:MAG: hypothetical protein SNJ79_12990 [Sphingomonadaceae bacterium]